MVRTIDWAIGLGWAVVCHPILALLALALLAFVGGTWLLLCVYFAALKAVWKGVVWFVREWQRTL